MLTFRQSLEIGDCTTFGLCIIQLYRDFFIWSLIFEFHFRFGFNVHGVVPYLIALRFDLEAPTQQVAVLFFTSKMLVKRHSDFLAFGFLTGVDIMVYTGMLSVNPSVVETISASRISLNCCWSSHLLDCLYNFCVL